MDAFGSSSPRTGHENADRHVEIIAEIVSAYVSNNSVRPADLPELIASVHSSIRALATGPAEMPAAEPQTPAVPVKKSVTKDFIICLEDGKKFRSLKRHLGSVYNMTPDEYRKKWNLPGDYPMVAPGYSEIRSRLARDIGLGQQRPKEPAAAAAGEAPAGTSAKKARAKKTTAPAA